MVGINIVSRHLFSASQTTHILEGLLGQSAAATLVLQSAVSAGPHLLTALTVAVTLLLPPGGQHVS